MIPKKIHYIWLGHGKKITENETMLGFMAAGSSSSWL